MQQLHGLDASFLYLENDTLKVQYSLLTVYDQSALKEPLSYRKIVDYFDERVRGIPLFRRKLFFVPLDLDSPYFADDPGFNIESHMRHIALPKPGDWRQFCILAAQIQAQPMDMNKPLWDMHVIEGLDNLEGLPAGSFAIHTRLHHAIADGTTARGILMALHHFRGRESKPLPPPEPLPPPTVAQMAVRGTMNGIRQWSEMPNRLSRILPGAMGALTRKSADFWLGGTDKPVNTRVPDTIFNSDMEYRRVFQLRRYPLEKLKRMRALAPGATLNDVVLAVLGGGMKRYLASQDQKHDLDLFAVCPVSLRSDKMTNDSLFGNNISMMVVNLNTRLATPAHRLKKIVALTSDAKLPEKAASAKELMELSENAPNLLLAVGSRLAMKAAMSGVTGTAANALITNVPGPQEPLYFMGARLELITGLLPITPSTGISLLISSYCGQLCISVTACRSWIEHPQVFAECLDESVEEMRKAASRLAVRTASKPVAETPPKPARKVARKPRAATKLTLVSPAVPAKAKRRRA